MEHICNKCNKAFNNKYYLKQHHNKKIPCDRVIKCDNCNKIFKQLSHLKNHLNRKNKCIKVDLNKKNIELEYENKLLKLELENEKLKKSSNTIINNTQNIINIFNNDGKIHHKYFLDSNPIEQLEMDKLSLESLTMEDYTDELSNIYNFTNMIKEVCFNMDMPRNWIICKDDMFNKLKLKIDNNNIVDCIDNILYLIYTIAKQVVNYDGLNIELKTFYESFIDKYDTNEFKDNKNLKQFINDFNKELTNHFTSIIGIISERKNQKLIEPLNINNFGEEDIRFIKKSVLDMELNSIIEKKYIYEVYNKSLKVNELRYYGIMDIKMIDMFIYFLRLIYNNDEQISNKTIYFKEGKFSIYKDNKWVVIKSKDLVNQIFTKIHLILKLNKIKLTDGVYTEDYCIESFKEKYTIHYTVGDVKKYSKILIEYYTNNNAFNDHEKNII